MKSLSEIKARLDAATPGPWHESDVCDHVFQTNHITRDIWNICHAPLNGLHDNWINDKAFIANAPTDIARLIAALELAIEQRDFWMNDTEWTCDHNKESRRERENAAIERVLRGEG